MNILIYNFACYCSGLGYLYALLAGRTKETMFLYTRQFIENKWIRQFVGMFVELCLLIDL